MARYNPIKNSFVAGETSPRMEGRDDLDQYFQSMRQAEGGIVLPTGGFMRRSGTRFVKPVKNADEKVRLIPFEVTDGAAYICEFGIGYVRFYTDEGRLEDGGGNAIEISSPYEVQLEDLFHAQEADVMYIVHPLYPSYKLTRTAVDAFSLTQVEYTEGRAPLRKANLDSGLTVTVSGSTLTWSADIGLDSADDVGRAVFIDDGSDPAWYEIDSVTSGSVAEATLKSGVDPAGAQSNWSLGASSDTEGFYAVALHEGRLGYGGTNSAPDRFWLSVSDSFDDFDLSNDGDTDAQNADKSITRRLVSNEGRVNLIQWMESTDDNLFIGTTGAEFRIRGENNDILTPSGTKQRTSTARGSRHIQPVSVDNSVIFSQKNGRKLRNFAFNLVSDNFQADEFSILAEHIIRIPVVRLAYQQDPNSVVWALREDGVLVGFTYEDSQGVNGAHRQILGGNFGGERPTVEDIAVIPSPDGSHSQLWMVVRRTINGATARYVEFLEEDFLPALTPASSEDERIAVMQNAFFVDSGVTYVGPSTDVITGLDHLEGETVAVLVNGGVHPNKVVTNGQIELERQSEDGTVHVGLPFRYVVETQRFVGGGRVGTDQGQLQRISKVTLRLNNTVGGVVGSGATPPGDKLSPIQSRTSNHLLGLSPPVFSGDRTVGIESNWTTEPTVYVAQLQPLPITVLSVMPRAETNEAG